MESGAPASASSRQQPEQAAVGQNPPPPQQQQPSALGKAAPNPDFDESQYEVDADGVYDEVDLDEMDFDEDTRTWSYPCPCGDLFAITEDQLYDGEEIATCPSCSLKLRVRYDPDEFMLSTEDESEEDH